MEQIQPDQEKTGIDRRPCSGFSGDKTAAHGFMAVFRNGSFQDMETFRSGYHACHRISDETQEVNFRFPGDVFRHSCFHLPVEGVVSLPENGCTDTYNCCTLVYCSFHVARHAH